MMRVRFIRHSFLRVWDECLAAERKARRGEMLARLRDKAPAVAS
jgi:hypothetical protein